MTIKYSQISKSGNKEGIEKKQNELLHNILRFLEMELLRLEVNVRRDILCTAHAQQAFLFLICCIL